MVFEVSHIHHSMFDIRLTKLRWQAGFRKMLATLSSVFSALPGEALLHIPRLLLSRHIRSSKVIASCGHTNIINLPSSISDRIAPGPAKAHSIHYRPLKSFLAGNHHMNISQNHIYCRGLGCFLSTTDSAVPFRSHCVMQSLSLPQSLRCIFARFQLICMTSFFYS